MADPPPLHIRRPDDPSKAFCGHRGGETISLAFWLDHVVPHRTSRCAGLWARLCRECDKRIPFPTKGSLQGG